MRILAIGDPHGNLERIKKISIKDVDLILLTGDLGKADLARKKFFENVERRRKGLRELKDSVEYSKKSSMEIYNSTINLLRYLSKFAPVYSITGNVWMSDNWVKKDEKRLKIKLPHLHKDFKKIKNFNLVRNKIKKINELKIGFLEYFVDNSWIKEFQEKDKKRINGAKKETEKAKRVLKKFRDLDILLCHQPPYGILDKVEDKASKFWRGKHAGSKVILNYVKKYHPRYVLCGHIHEGEGKKKIGKTEIYNLGVTGHIFLNID